MGIETELDEVFGSAYASAYYISTLKLEGSVYCIGMHGLTHELESFGINWKGSSVSVTKTARQ
jgi:4-nitrophenyl phosphatase